MPKKKQGKHSEGRHVEIEVEYKYMDNYNGRDTQTLKQKQSYANPSLRQTPVPSKSGRSM